MKKYILIKRENNQVGSICDKEPIDFDKKVFRCKEIDITKEDLKKIDSGHRMWCKTKFKLEKPPHLEKLDIEKEIDNARDINEIKTIIKKLI